MDHDTTIGKGPADLKVAPNLDNYDATRASFRWNQIPDLCAGMPGCNIAFAAVDRHSQGPEAGKTALRFIADTPTLDTRDISYAELGRLTRQFTNVLRGLGIGKGDKVFVIMGRVPELYISMLGALRKEREFRGRHRSTDEREHCARDRDLKGGTRGEPRADRHVTRNRNRDRRHVDSARTKFGNDTTRVTLPRGIADKLARAVIVASTHGSDGHRCRFRRRDRQHHTAGVIDVITDEIDTTIRAPNHDRILTRDRIFKRTHKHLAGAHGLEVVLHARVHASFHASSYLVPSQTPFSSSRCASCSAFPMMAARPSSTSARSPV
jgi:hypothetical protein